MIANTITGYKVITKDRKSFLTSLHFSGQISDDYKLDYPINERVKPKIKGSLILAFSTVVAARNFAHEEHVYGRIKIVKCEIENPIYSHGNFIFSPCDLGGINVNRILALWKNIANMKSVEVQYGRQVPDGTIFCTAITCLE